MTLSARIVEQFKRLDDATVRVMFKFLSLFLLLPICYGFLSARVAALERARTARAGILHELIGLEQRFNEASSTAGRYMNKMAAANHEDTPVSIVEQTGIKGSSGIQVKPLPRSEENGTVLEGAEIRFQGLSLNELVNLLYQLENHRKPVFINKAVVRKSYSDPSKIDFTLTVSLLRPPATHFSR
jgi:hypothetical protein